VDLISYLLEKIEKRQAEISETLMSNGVSSMEDYQHYIGRTSALAEIEQILRETPHRMDTAHHD